MAYKLPPLRFAYDALEPYIDAETRELHHDKHHQAYVDNVNKAIELYPPPGRSHDRARGPVVSSRPGAGGDPDYLLAWWNVVAWDVVDERLHNFMLETSQLQSPSSVVREEK